MFNTIYLGQVRVWLNPWYSKLELANEWFVTACTMHMVLFTPFVPELATQWEIGWSLIIFISILIAYNLVFIIYRFCLNIPLWILWLCVRAKHYLGVDNTIDKPAPEPHDNDPSLNPNDVEMELEESALDRTMRLNSVLSNYRTRSKLGRRRKSKKIDTDMSIIQECHEEATINDAF